MENILQSEDTNEYKKKPIGLFETPLWKVNQYLKNNSEIQIIPRKEIDSSEHIFPEINSENMTFQNDPNSFIEFDDPINIKKFGFDSNEMRKNGCGVSALYIVLNTFDKEKLEEKFKSVGELAIDALKMHRDDLIIGGKKIKSGTPVFNSKSGWYHDALIHEATKLDLASGERYKNVDLFDIAFKLIGLQKEGKKALAILSVKSDFWFIRRRTKDDTDSNHLIIINGFKFTDLGLTEIRVVDPYIFQDKKIVNKWIRVDNSKPSVLNKNVIIFYK